MWGIYKLHNRVQHYEWGSPTWIPALLQTENPDNKPWAELWMGSCSTVEQTSLDVLIKSEPDFFLGRTVNARFQGALPFLFKALAAEKPLSIQAHPNLAQAQIGFERENKAGIPFSAAERTYKDANHKPEIICALTSYEALCGFRTQAEIIKILQLFNCPVLKDLLQAETLQSFMHNLFAISDADKKELRCFIDKQTAALAAHYPEYTAVWHLAQKLAQHYPDDCAMIAPFYLNYMQLNPGEAVYLPAGILHCYIYGFGIELMANSDNVIRGGLTSKFIDTAELFTIVDFKSFMPAVLKPETADLFSYQTPAKEFTLSVLHNHGEKRCLPLAGPVILIITEGNCIIDDADGRLTLCCGESVFIAAGAERPQFTLSGSWTAYTASLGCQT